MMQPPIQPVEDARPANRNGDPANTADANGDRDPLRDLAASVEELQHNLRFLVDAKFDQIKAGVRRKIVVALAVIGAGLVGLAMVVTAAVYIMHGTALGLGSAFGQRMWLGYLVCGVGFLAMIAGGAAAFEMTARARRRKVLEEKYAGHCNDPSKLEA